MGILEKISDIEKEIAKTQKNKGNQQVFVLILDVDRMIELFPQPPSTIWGC